MARQKINAGTQLTVGVASSPTANMAFALNGSAVIPQSAMSPSSLPAGSVVQLVRQEETALASGTTAMVWDDTLPQNTEGFQVTSVSITPKSASNYLLVETIVNGTTSNGYHWALAVFRDSGVNAIAAAQSPNTNYAILESTIASVLVSASSTSTTTFYVRAGTNDNALTLYINGNAWTGVRKYGGAVKTFVQVTEIAA